MCVCIYKYIYIKFITTVAETGAFTCPIPQPFPYYDS